MESDNLLNWRSVYNMILKKREFEKISEFILKNKVCLEKNVDGKSLLYHAICHDEDIALGIINLKTNFINEESSVIKSIELKNMKILDLLIDKKINFIINPLSKLALEQENYNLIEKLMKNENLIHKLDNCLKKKLINFNIKWKLQKNL